MPTLEEQEDFRAKLEEAGLFEVKRRIALKIYAGWKLSHAKHWVEMKEEAARSDEMVRQAEVDDETLRIAKEGNQIARTANKISWWAIGVAILAVVVATAAYFKGG